MITLKVDPFPARNFLTRVEREQLPFALGKAISDTALDVQQVQRQHDARIFTVRRPEWLERTVKITHFANKREPWATIAIQPPGATGPQRADIIAKFEHDTAKESTKPGGHVAIPIRARRNKRDIIIGKHRPRAFNFRHVGRAIRGDQGTFIVRLRSGAELILQRVADRVKGPRVLGPQLPSGFRGRGAGGRFAHIAGERIRSTSVFALYYLVRRVRISPDLHFQENAEHAVSSTFQNHFTERFRQALGTARQG